MTKTRPAAQPQSGPTFKERERSHAGDYDETGVDLSLIRWMLKLSPRERLAVMERGARDTQRLLDYGRKHRQATLGRNR